MVARASRVVVGLVAGAALALAGCPPVVTLPTSPPPAARGAPVPSSTVAPPPPAGTDRRRPDGVIYGGAGGIGAGLSRPSTSKVVSPGFAAMGSLIVGLSLQDWAVLALRVDASVASGDGVGDVAAHVALYPGADGVGPIRDFQIFADAGVGGPLAQEGTTGGGTVTGVGRIGVAWERWTVATVMVGPFLAGQIARASTGSQASALAGVSLNFSGSKIGVGQPK